jgi:hypothetical protein
MTVGPLPLPLPRGGRGDKILPGGAEPSFSGERLSVSITH